MAARVTAEVVNVEHLVDLRVPSAPTMTIGPRTVTPVNVRIAYEGDEVTMVRIDGRGPSGFVDYYPLNRPADWPAWLAGLVEEHRPADRVAVRAAALAEAADAVWENRAVSYALEIEGWEGAHALLRRLAAAPNPTTQESPHA